MELDICNLTKKYKGITAVNHVNLHLEKGVYGLLGANGAGKSTFMKMLCTLLKPSEGEILYDRESIFSLDENYRDIIGYLPQKFGYYPDFTGYDFLMYMASLKGYKHHEAKIKTRELLATVNLSEYAKKRLNTYSGGMIQRLGIAQAMLNDPKILILDEPTAGLDPKERVRFRNIITQLSSNRIVLLSTHIVSDIESIANEILIMKKGDLIAQGSVEGVIRPIQNVVYEILIEPQELINYQQKFCISNMRNENNQILLRIVDSKQQLSNPAKKRVSAMLEDYYLNEFEEEVIDDAIHNDGN